MRITPGMQYLSLNPKEVKTGTTFEPRYAVPWGNEKGARISQVHCEGGTGVVSSSWRGKVSPPMESQLSKLCCQLSVM